MHDGKTVGEVCGFSALFKDHQDVISPPSELTIRSRIEFEAAGHSLKVLIVVYFRSYFTVKISGPL